MSSGEEIQAWLAEKNNPQTILADIGILFIPQAEEVGILADYEPPEAAQLPDDMHGPGWVATFTGVPAYLVNLDALEDAGVPVPETWADLTNPMYEGMSAWAGRRERQRDMGVRRDEPGRRWHARKLGTRASSTDNSFCRTSSTRHRSRRSSAARCRSRIRYDFNNATWFDQLEEDGVNYKLVIPKDGSVVAPYDLMLNQIRDRPCGLRQDVHGLGPLRRGAGDLRALRLAAHPLGRGRRSADRVPDEAKENWLPEEDYEVVETVDWRSIDPEAIREMWENEVVGGG